MIKKEITFKNPFDETDVTKEFWFHMDQGELAEVQMSKKIGFGEWLRIAQENDDPTIVAPAFRQIVLGAVGRREGDLFIKDEDAINSLKYSGAYGELIVWMLTNPIEAGEFVNGMLPGAAQAAIKDDKTALIEKMQAKVQEMSLNTEPSAFPVDPPQVVEKTLSEGITPSDEPLPEWTEPARPLAADFASMTPEEFEAWKTAQLSE